MNQQLLIALIVGGVVLAAAVGVGIAILVRRRRALPGKGKGDALPGASLPAPGAPPPGLETEDSAGLLVRLRAGLSRTKGQLVHRLDKIFASGALNEELLGELEQVRITSDVGVRTTTELLEGLRAKMRRGEMEDASALRQFLQDWMEEILVRQDPGLVQGEGPPLVIMVVGVNGSGKTTTIGKLASRYTREGKTVLLGAADTFRAAAAEQLEIWGERAGAEVIRREEGSDPASVAHDTLTAGVARNVDVIIVDTAGRLHTKAPLMEELQKVNRVLGKKLAGAPHETLLVIDANNGQNAIAQVKTFSEAVGISGIVLTKLDGTAKGGVIIGICGEMGIPVKLIGIGEQVDDLRDFVAADFVAALFSRDKDM